MAARRTAARILRQLRTAAEVSQEDAAEALGVHVGKIYKLENGLPGAKLSKGDVLILARLYGVDEETQDQLETLADAMKVSGPYQPYKDVVSPELDIYLGLEADSKSVSSYESELVPGLLQTEAYARAISLLPGADGRQRGIEEIDKRVKLRL
jgi:transcriptional regulator with XRE-family HTH domain